MKQNADFPKFPWKPDERILTRYQNYEKKLARQKQRRKCLLYAGSIAACFLFVTLLIVPMMKKAQEDPPLPHLQVQETEETLSAETRKVAAETKSDPGTDSTPPEGRTLEEWLSDPSVIFGKTQESPPEKSAPDGKVHLSEDLKELLENDKEGSTLIYAISVDYSACCHPESLPRYQTLLKEYQTLSEKKAPDSQTETLKTELAQMEESYRQELLSSLKDNFLSCELDVYPVEIDGDLTNSFYVFATRQQIEAFCRQYEEPLVFSLSLPISDK